MSRVMNSLLGVASNVLTVWPVIAGGVIVTSLFAWAAQATDRFAPYSPYSWICGGLIGLLILSILLLCIAKANESFINAGIRRKHSQNGDRLNPLSTQFDSQRVFISDLVSPADHKVSGKTFIDCELIGPANIGFFASKPGGTSIAHCGFINCVGAVVTNNVFVPAAIGFEDCTFLRCKFVSLLLLVPESSADKFVKDLGNLQWITRTTVNSPS